MSKPVYTHTVRVKGSDATPEPVTDAGLETMRKQFGERTFTRNYEVTPLAEKPADLPTTTTEKAGKGDKHEAGK